MHEGIDISAPAGATVVASASGTVIHAGSMGGYGVLVLIQHAGGIVTAYAHSSSVAVGVGQTVAQGQQIASVGCTGSCTGNHVHFEVWVGGRVTTSNAARRGDAQGTPFHAHFEFHPVALLAMGYDGVVDPYPYLTAWRRVEDVVFLAGSGWAPPVPASAEAPQPGAFLLESTDISSASGLEPGALERAPQPAIIPGGSRDGCAECERTP